MKKNTIRLLALLLCGVMLFAIAACSKDEKKDDTSNAGTASSNSGTSNQPASPSDTMEAAPTIAAPGAQTSPDTPNLPKEGQVSVRDTLSIAVSGDSGTLLPNGMTPGFASVANQFCEPLWKYTNDGTMVFVLATSIDNIDTLVWTVHLRDDVTFSNGKKFTAKDVMFSIDFFKAYVVGQYRELHLEDSRIIDDYTVELHFDPYPYAMAFAISSLYMYNEETFDADEFVTNPIGTGPYVVTEYVMNSHLYMKARDDYWGGKAMIENLVFRVFNEDAQRVNAIQSGLVDISTIPNQDIDFVSTLSDYTVDKYYTNSAPNLTYNMNPVSIMNNRDARIAVSHALNRDAVIKLVYFDFATLLHNPISTNCIGFEAGIMDDLSPVYSIGYNVDLAREYAEKAGIVGKDLVAITNGIPAYITTAEILQDNLKDIGVNLIINNYDAASYQSVQEDPTMYDIAISGTASPSGLAISMLTNFVLWYPYRYLDSWPGYSHYIEIGNLGLSIPDPAARRDINIELNQIHQDEVIWYGICDQMAAMAIKKGVVPVFWRGRSAYYNEWRWDS